MTKGKWKEAIVAACEEAGTYRPFFDAPIDVLAETMERRDRAKKAWKKNGSQTTLYKIDQMGNNIVYKNPELVMIDKMEQSALSYWRDLGLTPAGLRKLNADAMSGKKEEAATLGSVLKGLGI